MPVYRGGRGMRGVHFQVVLSSRQSNGWDKYTYIALCRLCVCVYVKRMLTTSACPSQSIITLYTQGCHQHSLYIIAKARVTIAGSPPPPPPPPSDRACVSCVMSATTTTAAAVTQKDLVAKLRRGLYLAHSSPYTHPILIL